MGDSWSCLSCLGAEEAPVSSRERKKGEKVSQYHYVHLEAKCVACVYVECY